MNIYESFFYNNMLRFSNDNFVPLKSLTCFAQGGTHKMLRQNELRLGGTHMRHSFPSDHLIKKLLAFQLPLYTFDSLKLTCPNITSTSF